MIDNTRAAAGEWRASWPLPLVSGVGYAASVTYLYSFGLFIEPLAREFGWTRADISLGLTICSGVVIVAGTPIGLAVDRWGSRRVALLGLPAYCLFVAMLSLAGPAIWTWWILWLLVGLGVVSIAPVVWTKAGRIRVRASSRPGAGCDDERRIAVQRGGAIADKSLYHAVRLARCLPGAWRDRRDSRVTADDRFVRQGHRPRAAGFGAHRQRRGSRRRGRSGSPSAVNRVWRAWRLLPWR